MFESFSDRTRRVVILAQQEVASLGHDWVGPEHLLLGLLALSDGYSYQALKHCGVTIEAARAAVVDLFGSRLGQSDSHIPFTIPAKKVLEVALSEGLASEAHTVNPEHILSGLLEIDGGALQVLKAIDVRPQSVRLALSVITSSDGSHPILINSRQARALLAWAKQVDPDREAPLEIQDILVRLEMLLK